MKRATIIVLDSVGIGGAEDAGDFGDVGANTLGHIAAACAAGKGDRDGLRKGPLNLPNLDRLGLAGALKASSGIDLPLGGGAPTGLWGYGVETSKGKDTPSGHWEIAGVPVPFDWGYFPETVPSFPKDLTEALIAQAAIPGILGNKHASGTEIIAELGEEHIRTGKPICYTSADSVFQIAAHETHFGLERLYEVCEIARELCDPLNIGRVIARPFVGETATTSSAPPTAATMPCRRPSRRSSTGWWRAGTARDRRRQDRRHLRPSRRQRGDQGAERRRRCSTRCWRRFDAAGDGDLVFANFVDFDTLYGHRRDVPGYAAALEAFDRRLPELEVAAEARRPRHHHRRPRQRPDLAGHRPYPRARADPRLRAGLRRRARSAARRFADMGETVAAHLGLAPGPHGTSFL